MVGFVGKQSTNGHEPTKRPRELLTEDFFCTWSGNSRAVTSSQHSLSTGWLRTNSVLTQVHCQSTRMTSVLAWMFAATGRAQYPMRLLTLSKVLPQHLLIQQQLSPARLAVALLTTSSRWTMMMTNYGFNFRKTLGRMRLLKTLTGGCTYLPTEIMKREVPRCITSRVQSAKHMKDSMLRTRNADKRVTSPSLLRALDRLHIPILRIFTVQISISSGLRVAAL